MVHEPQFEGLHAAATLREKGAELGEQGGHGCIEAGRISDLGFEVASGRESLAWDEILARIRPATDRAIEHVEHLWLETTRKTVAWQTQAIADRAHAHRGERLEAALGPAGAMDGEVCKTAGEVRWMTDDAFPARTRHPERCDRGRGRRTLRLEACGAQLCTQSLAQSSRTAEESQAAAHLEQHRIGRLDAHTGAESQGPFRQ